MKKELSPAVIAAVVVIVLALVGWFGYQQLKPGSYVPSPRMGAGTSGADAPEGTAPAPSQSPGEKAYQQSMNAGGAVPGDTPGAPGTPAAPGSASADSGSPTTGPSGQVHVAPD